MADAKRKIELRSATLGDVNTLCQLGRDAFAESYGPFNTPEDLAAHIEQTYAPKLIRTHLEDDSQTYLLAQVDGAAAGFGLLSSGPSPEAVLASKPFKVQQLYVLRSYQRLRLGSKLIEALATLAVGKGGDVIWLTVWEHADWARKFYQRCEFEAVGKVEFKLGSSDQTDILMARTL